MKGWKRIRSIILFTGLCMVILILISGMIKDGRARGEAGGTDENIEINAETGGLFFQWNQVHGIIIYENDTKIEEPFNVTICESIVDENGTFESQGHIFGGLSGIRWDDEPEPSIIVLVSDYYEYAGEDNHSLTVYVLGTYQREIPNGSETRQAYILLEIYRPNEAPEAVVSVTGYPIEGEADWTGWKNTDNKTHFNDMGELVFCINETDDLLRLHCNASNSRDPDGDTIIRWSWDLDDDGSYGVLTFERKMNTTLALGRGDHVIGLMVFDGRNWSEILKIPILVRTYHELPDLVVLDLNLENYNGEDIFQQGDLVKIRATTRNLGETPTSGNFHAVLFYRFDEPGADYQIMDTVIEEGSIEVNQLQIIEFTWKTWLTEFDPGMYSFL